ncbi:hypothetical protein J5N97_000469 [Dioscorea zingiberensis]|uniref:Uncharacterized protein n=1 Tax=Dioscorea zingiberensis TaxID=325984 RepID=A0A9D5BSC5_9LILI|nr:hypothetical protein J5N97_000469 [Dioscorea zingiberensis]
MISFEQCYHLCDPRITNYAMLLDILINTPKDIDILCKYGIIKNWLNPEKASQIFDNLYSDTYVTEFYYHLELSQEVNKYCKRRWPRWRAIRAAAAQGSISSSFDRSAMGQWRSLQLESESEIAPTEAGIGLSDGAPGIERRRAEHLEGMSDGGLSNLEGQKPI